MRLVEILHILTLLNAFLDAKKLKQTFHLPNDSPRRTRLMFTEDRASIGCNQVIYADASQTPIFKPNERAIHTVPREMYHESPARGGES
eukprot:2891881-Amphidinium_carterae.2